MPEIVLFCEDSFHENFVKALIERFRKDYAVEVKLKIYSASGGFPRMQSEFQAFLRDVARHQDIAPDWIIVVADANCAGFSERKRHLEKAVAQYPNFEKLISYAIPEPHIERWMLVDSKAFSHVFGRGCTLPKVKCAKDEYKRLLSNEIKESGTDPLLGGEEFAEDIVAAMDLSRAEIGETSLGLFLKAIKGRFNSWKSDASELMAQ